MLLPPQRSSSAGGGRGRRGGSERGDFRGRRVAKIAPPVARVPCAYIAKTTWSENKTWGRESRVYSASFCARGRMDVRSNARYMPYLPHASVVCAYQKGFPTRYV